MKCSALVGVAAVVAACEALASEEVRVSDFGWDAEDSTRFVQAALDSEARRVVFDRQSGPWVVTPVKARSGQTVVFEDGVELLAKKGAFAGIRDYLFECNGITNFTLIGKGIRGGIFRMRKQDYLNPPYKFSEWRYALRIHDCNRLCVSNMSFVSSGGDGIVVGGRSCRDIVIDRCVCDDNYRQAVSVCCVENLLIRNCTLKNTGGTLPSAGIDFEPDNATERLVNCRVSNCRILGNKGYGVLVYPGNLRASSPPVDIVVADCEISGNGYGTSITWTTGDREKSVRGLLVYTNCQFSANFSAPIVVARKPAEVPIVFFDCTVSNETHAVTISDGKWQEPTPDGVMFRNLTVCYPEGTDWFGSGCGSLNPRQPQNIVGNVIVSRPTGCAESVTLDASWRQAHLAPPVKDTLPERVKLDMEAKDAELVDAAPDEMVPLEPFELLWGARYVFYVDKPRLVRFRMRQCRKKAEQRFADTYQGFVKRHLWQKKPLVGVPQPGFETREFSFEIAERGFYHLIMPAEISRFVLEASNVPVGIHTADRQQQAYNADGLVHSLWVQAPAGRKMAFMFYSGNAGEVSVGLFDAAGECLSVGCASVQWNALVAKGDGGLYRVDIKEHCALTDGRYFIFDLVGVPPILFLSNEKTVRFR